jgi:hypothetical protein
MKNSTLFLLSIFFIGTTVFAQEKKIKQGLQGHTNQNKFNNSKINWQHPIVSELLQVLQV